ncbi:MAG: hypothetical protein IK033_07230, partial [Verrucomicrobia bacterium]|nr:hypothetical protein [Verrucomicrobiota bacterium]
MKLNYKTLVISCLIAGALLTSLNVQAEEPTISYSLKMEINYTGELYQSTDGVTWTKVEGASNPYYVSV